MRRPITLSYEQCNVLILLAASGPCPRDTFKDTEVLDSLTAVRPALVKRCDDNAVRISWIGRQIIYCASMTAGSC